MGKGENRFKNIWNEVFRWSSNRSLAPVWCITSLLPYSTYLYLVFQDCQVFSLTKKSLATGWPVAPNWANHLNHFGQTFSMNLSKTI